MIPIGDEPVTHRTPFVTYLVLAANVLIFAYELSLGGRQLEQFIQAWAVRADEVTAVVGGRIELLPRVLLTSLTAMFIHGSWPHIVGNMLFLWVFGDNVEDNFGPLSFLVFYLLSGMTAVLAQSWLTPTSPVPMIGASGAISGILAGYLLLHPGAAIRAVLPLPFLFLFPFFVPAWLMIMLWFAGQLLNGYATLTDTALMSGGVAYGAHIGGFVGGFVLALFFRRPQRRPRYAEDVRNRRYYR